MNVKDAKIVFFGFGDVGYKCLKYLLENDYFVLADFKLFGLNISIPYSFAMLSGELNLSFSFLS